MYLFIKNKKRKKKKESRHVFTKRGHLFISISSVHHILLFQDSPHQWFRTPCIFTWTFREYDPIVSLNSYKVSMGYIVIYNMFKYPQYFFNSLPKSENLTVY